MDRELRLIVILAIFAFAYCSEQNVTRVIDCPICEELKSRNADTNPNDTCHDVYEYVCNNQTVVQFQVKPRTRTSIETVVIHDVPKSSETTTENYTQYDNRVKEHMKEQSMKINETLFGKSKKYSSRVMKLPSTFGRSAIDFSAVNATHADLDLINHTFAHMFSKPRNNFYNLTHKQWVRKAVLRTFQTYGLKTEVQKFKCEGYDNGSYVTFDGQNLIGVLPSERYGKKGDRLFLIGGHYDTVYLNPGIDDNGSGSIAVLEAARLLSNLRDKLNATVYFVLFDQEESGLEGSTAFVSEYFIPKILNKNDYTFVGAYVTDMVLLHDTTPNVQTLPYDVIELCPDAFEAVKNNSRRGDFISVWAREADKPLWSTLEDTWNEITEIQNDEEYKILVLKTPIEANFYNITPEHYYTTFIRSDHAPFWMSEKYDRKFSTLPAVLLCDLGPWRGYQRKCYHQPCDNSIQLTDTNLHFMAKIINSVVASTVKLIGKESTDVIN